MREEPLPLLLGIGVAALAFAVYAATLSPSIGFIDSGELAAAAHSFGIAHPTGYPLFVWLAGAWSYVPFSSVIVRLNLFSALATAAAAGVCVVLTWRLLGRQHGCCSPGRGLAALSAGLFLAFNRTVWSNALAVEVYALQTLLLVALLDSMVSAISAARATGAARAWRRVALLAGLSFSNHLTTVQLLPGLAIAWRLAGPAGAAWRRLLVLGAFFAVGLVPYLHLPLRAAQDPAMNWGDPRTLQALFDHVTAREYRGRFLMGLEPFLLSLRAFVTGLPQHSGILPLALAAAGALAVRRRDRAIANVLGASLLASIGMAASYAIPDIASYYLLGYVVLAILGGYGMAQLLAWLTARRRLAGIAVAVAAVSTLALGNWDISERGNFLVEDFANNMFRSLLPHAIAISYQWDHWVSPALYLQQVEGLRPDVLVIDKRLCQRAWYVRQLARRHPELCRGAQRELAALLAAAETAGGRGVDPALSGSIDAFLQALVDANFEQRPIYVTVDVEAGFPSGYRQIAEGLALRLYRPERPPPPDASAWDAFRYRPFARRDGWTDRLRQYYAVMLMGRGAFLEDARRPHAAAGYYARALGFEPSPSVREQILARLARVRSAAAVAPSP